MIRIILFSCLCFPIYATEKDFRVHCVVDIDGEETEVLIPQETIRAKWTTISVLKKRSLKFLEGTHKLKSVLLLENKRSDLVKLCRDQIRSYFPMQTYFVHLKKVRAYRDDPDCHGHDVLYEQDGKIALVFSDKTEFLKRELSSYNFGVILDGFIYRSKSLGKKGVEEVSKLFAEQNIIPLKSIASIHVMGFGGPYGSYNLEEMAECEKREMTFLHSFHFDPSKTIFMDGTDPSHVDESGSQHGNIFKQDLFDEFIPDKKVQLSLRTKEILASGRKNRGDTMDFLTSLENLIDASWPILIHCKGGRHKTGMFAMIFQYLLDNLMMDPRVAHPIRIPAYKNRISDWWTQRAGFTQIFAGDFYSKLNLAFAEEAYYVHNNGAFRLENLTFIRRVIDGSALQTPELKKKWETVREKFNQKYVLVKESEFNH